MEHFLNEALGSVDVEIHEASNPKGTIIIGHGAGAGMHHPFMVELANEISTDEFHAIRFNFPYMQEGRKSPGSPKKNIETWSLITQQIQNQYPKLPIFLSGKSYGGRMASHLLAEKDVSNVNGIVYFGFPLHAPGKDSIDRANHLSDIKVPQLFLQGTKDKLANTELINEVAGNLKSATIINIDDADHSFNVPKKLGISKKDMISNLAKHAISFMKKNVS